MIPWPETCDGVPGDGGRVLAVGELQMRPGLYLAR